MARVVGFLSFLNSSGQGRRGKWLAPCNMFGTTVGGSNQIILKTFCLHDCIYWAYTYLDFAYFGSNYCGYVEIKDE